MISTVSEFDHCIFHMESHNILQGFELCLPCLNLEFGRTANLLDVLKKYKILGFCGLGLNRLKSYRTKT